MYVYLLDNNLLNYACSSPNGRVISKINEGISALPLLRQEDTAFMMTPFSIIEALGITWPAINVVPDVKTLGGRVVDVVGSVIERSTVAYRALPVLQPEHLTKRALERRSYVDAASRELFDICVANKAQSPDFSEALAKSLGYDHAFQCVYPKNIRKEVERFFVAAVLIQKSAPTLTMFRIIKRVWDIYFLDRQSHPADRRDEIEQMNRSMRLKSTRDLLDCDLIHFACFGWGEHPVAAFTCDPPEVILHRLAIYKSFVRIFMEHTEGIPTERLPEMNFGLILRCDPDGTITHVFPANRVPFLR